MECSRSSHIINSALKERKTPNGLGNRKKRQKYDTYRQNLEKDGLMLAHGMGDQMPRKHPKNKNSNNGKETAKQSPNERIETAD